MTGPTAGTIRGGASRRAACIGETELIATVKERLAGYKAPRHVLFVESVGRAPNGKADYAGVRKRIQTWLVDTSPRRDSRTENEA